MRTMMVALLSLFSGFAVATQGLERIASPHDVAMTIEKLEAVVTAKGFRIFARVDHDAGAKTVDMALRPTKLLIFGNPKGGTLLMQENQTVGIDLPLKYLVWQDADGKVWVGWNSPAFLQERHQLPAQLPVLGKMTKGLAGMAKAATAP